jgi:hypothetical protein
MMTTHPRPQPQRIAWFDGSALTHRDLADAIEHEARMLELHVRAVHDTFGIAFGLTTSLSTDRRSVVVQRGLAYTCRGASLVMLQSATIAAPPASMSGAAFDLVLMRATPPAACAIPEVDCAGARIRAHATLQWLSVDDASTHRCACGAPDDAVHLGRFTRSGHTLSTPDNSPRRGVHAPIRPHVVSGLTRPGALTWKQSNYDLYAEVDTSAGGFTGSPAYFVSIASPLPWSGGLVAPFVSVGQATATHFNVHVMIVAKPPAFSLLFAQIDLLEELSLSWTGVESAVGCSGNSLLTNAGVLNTLTALGATP